MSNLTNSFHRLSITPKKGSSSVLVSPFSTTKRELKSRYNNYITEARNIEKNCPNLYDDYDKLKHVQWLYESAYALFKHDQKLKKKIESVNGILSQFVEEYQENVSPNILESTVFKSDSKNSTKSQTRMESLIELPELKRYEPAANSIATKHSTQMVSRTKEANRFTILKDGFIHDSQKNLYRLPDSFRSLPSDPSSIKSELVPYYIPANIYQKLYDYQRDAIKWFWKKHCEAKKDNRKSTSGGILGDDMGLGKTIQVIAYLAGLFRSNIVDYVLICVPVSVIQNWKKEFTKWASDMPLYIFHNLQMGQRELMIEEFAETGGVLLTSYGMITSQIELFTNSFEELDFCFDYIFLDEGHKVKNPKIRLSLCLRTIPVTTCKFILTGTPVQNNLMEMWALFDYLFDGRLLGSFRSFKDEFEKKIVRATEKDASQYEKQLGNQLSSKLWSIIEPHLLRREKSVVLKASTSLSISQKNDLIIWIRNSDRQTELYKNFLTSAEVRAVLNRSQSALAALTILKQICCHPNLLAANKQKAKTVRDMIQQSGKLRFLEILLKRLYGEKHRVLIFSQSVQMLYIISKLLDSLNYSHLQLDGSISDSRKRQKLIDTYNSPNSKYFCFLLTSQVGGFGITLTSADRVVIFDPSWNPAVDSQAVDRAYRIGQTKNVIVYRLITCGTIEEKIYRKQVFKGSLSKKTIEKASQHRYFTHSELRELFTMGNSKQSETQQQLLRIHKEVTYYAEMQNHLKYMEVSASDVMAGYSDHNVLFSKKDEEIILCDTKSAPNTINRDVINTPVLKEKRSSNRSLGTSTKRPVFTGSELSQLLKGIRIYGEEENWEFISLEFFPNSNFSASVLEKAWSNFKKGKSVQDLKALLSQFDQEFDVLPPFPHITDSKSFLTEQNGPAQSVNTAHNVVDLEDEDDPPEPMESVCRRVSMGLGLLAVSNSSSDDERYDFKESNGTSTRSVNRSYDRICQDSLIVDDNNYMSDDNENEELHASASSLQFAEREDSDIEMTERKVSVRKPRKNINIESDDEDMDDLHLESERFETKDLTEPRPLKDDTANEQNSGDNHLRTSSVGNLSPVRSTDNHLSDKYVQYIFHGRKAELTGDLTRALAFYMKALEQSDHDNKLHCKICSLARKLHFY